MEGQQFCSSVRVCGPTGAEGQQFCPPVGVGVELVWSWRYVWSFATREARNSLHYIMKHDKQAK